MVREASLPRLAAPSWDKRSCIVEDQARALSRGLGGLRTYRCKDIVPVPTKADSCLGVSFDNLLRFDLVRPGAAVDVLAVMTEDTKPSTSE